LALSQFKAGVHHSEYKKALIDHGVVKTLVHVLYKKFMKQHVPDILDILLTLVCGDGDGDRAIIRQIADAEGIRILVKLYMDSRPDKKELDKTLQLMAWLLTEMDNHAQFVYDGGLSRLDEIAGNYKTAEDRNKYSFQRKAKALLDALTMDQTVVSNIYVSRRITFSE
jgi:hypothetical protein